MAIMKPRDPAQPNTVVQGLLVVTPSNSATVLQLANNNRSGPQQGALAGTTGSSAGFKNLDQLIRNLDAEYDALPDKTPWLIYAYNIAGFWQLCANCQPDTAAKKLFRQYNFNRTRMGLPTVAGPIDDTAYVLDWPCTAQANPLTTPATAEWYNGDITANLWRSPSLSYSLQNALLHDTPGSTNTYFAGNQWFTFVYAVVEQSNVNGIAPPGGYIEVPICQWDDNGAPGAKGVLTINASP